jgi:2-C-methyl-D-erythritol 4-phosphate cytidylyltransferase
LRLSARVTRTRHSNHDKLLLNVCVIIPAAGKSSRFGAGDKLAQDLGGRAVLLRTVEIFTKRDEVKCIVVAGPHDDFEDFRAKFGPTLGFHGAKLIPGGKTHRWETVKAALDHPDAIPADATHIAIHDAARPGVSAEVLDRIFEAARTLDAVIPVTPINATIKRVEAQAVDVRSTDDDILADVILGDAGKLAVDARKVQATIDRANLVEVQTPQVFEIGLIRRAYRQANLEGDAEVVERLGETVHAVEGDVRNFKITRSADLSLMRSILGLGGASDRASHKRF